MKKLQILLFCFVLTISATAQLMVTEVGALPVAVANNAVCEGFIGDKAYLFSFGGIDSTKIHSGIHLKSFRYDLTTGENLQLANLPDTRGKIAAAASRIGNIIYISGGYYVFPNGSERSSNHMHRYDIENNTFLTDGASIPVATDDHVQAIWRDSLIYVITGWSNTRNIPNVQIYNPSADTWLRGTSLPNTNDYKSFGASGTIVGDTIYYFGGATSARGFGIQNHVRKGIINPNDPTKIEWSISAPDAGINGYRMACTTVNNELHWVGGSNITYNFDGIAYNNSGGVPPSNRDLYTQTDQIEWQESFVEALPMDLRGIAEISETVKYLAGGMSENQTVSNKVYRLEWQNDDATNVEDKLEPSSFVIYPNPFSAQISIKNVRHALPSTVTLYTLTGTQLLQTKLTNNLLEMTTDSLPSGVYFLHIQNARERVIEKLVKP